MDWLKRMNGAIKYIEENLTNEIDYNNVAKIACCSNYHFQRMFSFITDVPLAEYIRRRRLTLAALELQNSNIKVIDLALKYGYESPEAFTRAFNKLHGVPPTMAREMGTLLKAYPPLSFHISIKGDAEMNYKVVEKGSFKFFGVEEIIDLTNGNNLIRIPKFWEECYEAGIIDKLSEVQQKVKTESEFKLCVANGIMGYRDTGKDTMPYMIGVVDFEDELNVPEEYTLVSGKSFTWVVFRTEEHYESEVTEKIQELWRRIFQEWFPSSGYEHAEGPEMELYYTADDDRFFSEVWIPIIKK